MIRKLTRLICSLTTNRNSAAADGNLLTPLRRSASIDRLLASPPLLGAQGGSAHPVSLPDWTERLRCKQARVVPARHLRV